MTDDQFNELKKQIERALSSENENALILFILLIAILIQGC